MKPHLFFLFLVSLLTIIACEDPIDETMIVGEWACAEFIEQGKPKDVKAQNIKFSFTENDRYSYTTTNYQEAGRYNITGRLLYTTDTLTTPRVEKSVKIAHSTQDSLYFEMNAGGVAQLIKLYRVN